MVKYTYVCALFLILVGHISCGQNPTNAPKDNSRLETKEIVPSPGSDERNIHTKYEYTDSTGKRLILQNGFPRGGSRYTDPDGEVYGYAIFWTRIINETDHPLELKIDFLETYEVPSIPGKYFKILVLPDTMTMDKVPLFNYGLTNLESFLDKNIHTPSTLKRTIDPKASSGFYFLKLSLVSEGIRGGGDILRTGLLLKGQNLFYKVSVYGPSTVASKVLPSITGEEEIDCGKINLTLNE